MVNLQLVKTLKGKKVFVTGHTGFKGAWLILILNWLGAITKGYALAPKNKTDLYLKINGDDYCQSVIADIRNYEKLKAEIIDFEPDIIIHMAAQALVIDSYKNPLETYSSNVMGTAHVLDTLRFYKKPCATIIITTDKVYWNYERQKPYNENERLGGFDPYSNSKACADLTTNSYRLSFFPDNNFKSHQKSIAIVRSGNVIGGGDRSENRIIPDLVNALEKNKTLQMRNPLAVRPWQHVLEPLFGYLLLAANMLSKPQQFNTEFNFGPEENDVLTVENLVKIAIKQWGSGNYQITQNNQNHHEAGLLKLSINKAKSQLNWVPKFTSETSIINTINWYKEALGNEATYTLKQIKAYFEY